MKTLLAIILFGLALKAFGTGAVKKPIETPLLPDGTAAKDEAAIKGEALARDEKARAQLKAERFLAQVEAYTDVRLMKKRQRRALQSQLEQVSEINESAGEARRIGRA